MHPIHEQFARTPPANSLQELFALLESFEGAARSTLVTRLLLELEGESLLPLDISNHHFKDRCHHLATVIPENLVVQKLIIGCLWQLLNAIEPLLGKIRRRKLGDTTRQRTLFPLPDEESQPNDDNRLLYEALCNAIRKHLLPIPDSHEQSVALLALSEIRGVGYWTVRRIAQQMPLADLFSLENTADFNDVLRSVGSKGSLDVNTPLCEWRERAFIKGETLLSDFSERGISILHRFSPDFPPQLNDLEDPPDWLFVQGDSAILHRRSVAVVGTRTPTDVGIDLAEIIGNTLPQLRSVLVSGLAEGIDQTMHLSSLKHNVPTIAVLGTGILNNYPSGSEVIRDEICRRGGAIVTEYLPRESYSAQNFVRRNRIQAGLASVIIPVEWRSKSGTAHTVNFAYNTHRRIVCVKPPDWQSDARPELRQAMEMGATVFTLPDELQQFIVAVSE